MAHSFVGLRLVSSGSDFQLCLVPWPHRGACLPGVRREHALYLQWCYFAEATFARPLGEMVNHRREFDPPRDEILAEMARRGQLCVRALDEALADGRQFILGDEFSAADISLGYTMMLATAPDKCPMFAPLDEYATALAYFERLQARPAFKRATNPASIEAKL